MLQSKRQIQTVLDSSKDREAKFHLITRNGGHQHVQGTIDPSVLTKNEKTLLLHRPMESYYQHYERPMNKKLIQAAADEWTVEQKKLYNMTPVVRPMQIANKYETMFKNNKAFKSSCVGDSKAELSHHQDPNESISVGK